MRLRRKKAQTKNARATEKGNTRSKIQSHVKNVSQITTPDREHCPAARLLMNNSLQPKVVDLTTEKTVIDLTVDDAVDIAGEPTTIDLTTENNMVDLTGCAESPKRKKMFGSRAHPVTGRPEQECSICMNTGATFKLSCGHHFHRRCVDKWNNRCYKRFNKEPHCPLCTQLVKHEVVVKCTNCAEKGEGSVE